MTSATFKHFGYTPLLKHLFIKSARTEAIIGFASFRNLVFTSMCLTAFEVLNLSILLITSFEQVDARKNESLTLIEFYEFNSVKSEAGNNFFPNVCEVFI